MLRIILAAAAVFLASCGKRSDAPDGPSGAGAEPVGMVGRDAIGRIYHYVRSNIDGTEAEDVYVFRKRRDYLEVYKARSKCENAALVTAEIDMDRKYATRLTGGRLKPGAQQEPFAVLTYDPAAKQLSARIDLPDREPLTTVETIEGEYWHLYDFDFASLTVMTPHIEPRSDFSFGLALAINDIERPDFLEFLGRADMTYRRDEERNGRPAFRYVVGGPAFGNYGGSLWLDAEDGHILDVETGIPNHLEYESFKLSLQDVDDGGLPSWVRLLNAHFEGCEEEAAD